MNMQALMQQAQKMQRDIMKKKEELNQKEFTGTSELVDVVVLGDKSIKSVKIKDVDLSDDDKEVLEDMVVLVINDAMKKVDAETEKVMGPLGGSLNGLL